VVRFHYVWPLALSKLCYEGGMLVNLRNSAFSTTSVETDATGGHERGKSLYQLFTNQEDRYFPNFGQNWFWRLR